MRVPADASARIRRVEQLAPQFMAQGRFAAQVHPGGGNATSSQAIHPRGGGSMDEGNTTTAWSSILTYVVLVGTSSASFGHQRQ